MMIVRNNIPVVGLKTVYEVHFQDEMIFAYLKRNLAVHDSVDVLFISTKTLNTYYGGQIDNVHIANGLEIKRLGENHYSIISYDDGYYCYQYEEISDKS